MTKPPETDAEMAAAHVSGMAPSHDGAILLADYDPAWPKQYAAEAAKISAALGELALVLEHVGSTSAPGIPAKPVLDILVAVADSADEGAYAPALTAAGYRLHIREPDWEQHRRFKGADPEVNLHVFTQGSGEIRRMLAFRDRRRDHPEEMRLYAETKQALAGRVWRYVQHYANTKSEVVEAIVARALEEDAQSGRG